MHFSVSYKFWLNSSFYSTNLILAITETFQFTTQLLRFYDDFMFLHSFHHLDTAATLIDDAFTGSFIFKNNQRPLQHQQQLGSSTLDQVVHHLCCILTETQPYWIFQTPRYLMIKKFCMMMNIPATSKTCIYQLVIPYCPSNNQEKWKFIKFHQSSTLARFICKTII